MSREGYGTTIRDFPVAVWILLKNPIFVFVSFAAACEFLLVGGFAAFLSKFIQNQYGQSASFAAILTGNIIFMYNLSYFCSPFKVICEQLQHFSIFGTWFHSPR